MSTDIERIRRDILLSETAARFGVKLEKDGYEFVACCPFHNEDTPSFTIFTGRDRVQRFYCFGCGKHGDIFDFVGLLKGVEFKEAKSILTGEATDRPNVARVEVPVRDIYAGIEPLNPAGQIEVGKRVPLFNPKRSGTEWEWGRFTPSMVFPYRRADGSLMGYVLRRDLPDGGKETPMVMWVRLPNGRECWSRFPFAKPRPLYGLDKIGDARQVVVAEGEKCRDKLATTTGRVVVSWAGGTQGVKHTDWTPLRRRNVVIWPDADGPGLATAEDIAAVLGDLGATVRVMDVMRDNPPNGWDAADAIDDGWGKDECDNFMRATVRPWSPPAETKVDDRPAPPIAASGPVVEARTVQQEQPASATVTQLHTRKTVAADDNWQLGLVCNEDGKVKPGVTKNWALFLEHHKDMEGTFAFDEFKRVVMLMRKPPWDWRLNYWEPRKIADRDYSEAVMWLEGKQMTPKASNIAAVIQTVAEHNGFDPLCDYLDGLKWDGKARVGTWLSYYLGVEDSDYARTVAACWLVSSVARGLRPGCKVDTMPILEGPQGALKSTAIRTLYGDQFFTDGLSDIGSKDAKMEMQGVWGLEVAEMQKFNAAETNEVKKFLTQQVDRYRPPYGRSVIEAPRRVVLCGTINPEGNAYLRDPTGARRFWPIVVGRLDIEGLAKDRDQLWAEAVHMFKAGAKWWVQEEHAEAVMAEQEKRTDVDVWTAIIAPMLLTRTSITQWEVFDALHIAKKDAGWQHSARVGRIMKKLRWLASRDRKNGEDRVVYSAPKGNSGGNLDLGDAW